MAGQMRRPRPVVLLDPDAMEAPDRLTAEDCLAETGPDSRWALTGDWEQEDDR